MQSSKQRTKCTQTLRESKSPMKAIARMIKVYLFLLPEIHPAGNRSNKNCKVISSAVVRKHCNNKNKLQLFNKNSMPSLNWKLNAKNWKKNGRKNWSVKDLQQKLPNAPNLNLNKKPNLNKKSKLKR